ncbi:hypothetical protein [Streptomyces subrutilus]|uniref:hypothetical protein n=1 Tax=Streptomyces subrutilus TaxID=36818 RepID=UPI0033E72D0D
MDAARFEEAARESASRSGYRLLEAGAPALSAEVALDGGELEPAAEPVRRAAGLRAGSARRACRAGASC